MMKTIEYYMNLPYKMEVFPDMEEGGFVVSFPELPGCISCGKTMESAIENAMDAKRAWIEAELEEKKEIPQPDNADKYSGQFKLRIPKSLHKTLSDHAKQEGISMNQYCMYLLSRNDALYHCGTANMVMESGLYSKKEGRKNEN